MMRLGNGVSVFQSTLPLRGATYTIIVSDYSTVFQSTLPLRGATNRVLVLAVHFIISIHTPLAGSDLSFNGAAVI